jgi:hypothetical protein
MTPVYRRLRDHALVLAEGGALRAFSRAGQVRALLAWCGRRLHTVREVYQELDREREEVPDHARLLAWLEDERRLVELAPAGKLWVAKVATMLGPSRIGCIASARAARDLPDPLRGAPPAAVLVDDRMGGRICARLGVPVVPAHRVLLDLVREQRVTPDEGRRIWLELGRPEVEYVKRAGAYVDVPDWAGSTPAA